MHERSAWSYDDSEHLSVEAQHHAERSFAGLALFFAALECMALSYSSLHTHSHTHTHMQTHPFTCPCMLVEQGWCCVGRHADMNVAYELL